MADVLTLSTVGIKKTHIMYKANLSYEQILYYLNELLAKGLLEQGVEEGSPVYRTTERGREFLGHFTRMVDLIRQYPEERTPLLAQ